MPGVDKTLIFVAHILLFWGAYVMATKLEIAKHLPHALLWGIVSFVAGAALQAAGTLIH